ncbi:MAG: hypothetical protein WBR13_12505 [Allosphingosinicella sp.]
MNQKQAEQIGGATSAESRTEWIRPQVDRFAAGSAEAADVNGPDGPQTS